MSLPEVRCHHIDITKGTDENGIRHEWALVRKGGGGLDLSKLNHAERLSVIARIALHNLYHSKAENNPERYQRSVEESNLELKPELQAEHTT